MKNHIETRTTEPYIAEIHTELLNDDVLNHRHICAEIDMTLSGCGLLCINNSPYTLKRGSLSFIFPPDFHSIHPDEDIENYHITFNPNAVNNENLKFFMHNTGSFHIYLNDEQINQITNLFKTLQSIDAKRDVFSTSQFISTLETILFLILGYSRMGKSLSNTSAKMFPILEYINTHFTEQITLSEVANRFFISEKHLSREFKKNFRIGFNEYIIQKRLSYAASMLIGTKKTITFISETSGFNSAAYFSKKFKEKFNISPSDYAKINRI